MNSIYYLLFVAGIAVLFQLTLGEKVLFWFLFLILLSMIVIRWSEIDQVLKTVTGKEAG